MNSKSDARRKIEDFCQQSGKYTPDAYEFITECVVRQVHDLHKDRREIIMDQERHITAEELLTGVRRQLIDQFGFMAPLLLQQWKVNSADDVGEIVFDLIDLGILGASDEDNRSDFKLKFDLLPPREAHYQWKKPSAQEMPQID